VTAPHHRVCRPCANGLDHVQDPSGRILISTNEFTYTDEQVDSSGLQYLRARYYDAATGRFASRDPLPLMQRYSYVGGNPVNLVDPTGLCSKWPPSEYADCLRKAAEKAAEVAKDSAIGVGNEIGKAAKSTTDAMADAAQYCLSSEHLFECYERFEVGSVGVAVTAFGAIIAGGGCIVVAPVVGVATAGAGGVVTCGLAVFAGATVIAGGVLIIDGSMSPWHHGVEAAAHSPSRVPSKE
jgi:RHS repeat-associated protein